MMEDGEGSPVFFFHPPPPSLFHIKDISFIFLPSPPTRVTFAAELKRLHQSEPVSGRDSLVRPRWPDRLVLSLYGRDRPWTDDRKVLFLYLSPGISFFKHTHYKIRNQRGKYQHPWPLPCGRAPRVVITSASCKHTLPVWGCFVCFYCSQEELLMFIMVMTVLFRRWCFLFEDFLTEASEPACSSAQSAVKIEVVRVTSSGVFLLSSSRRSVCEEDAVTHRHVCAPQLELESRIRPTSFF